MFNNLSNIGSEKSIDHATKFKSAWLLKDRKEPAPLSTADRDDDGEFVENSSDNGGRGQCGGMKPQQNVQNSIEYFY